MAAPSLIATRRFSHPVRLRLQVIFAQAWEALAETYRSQAADFVRRLRTRLPADEALDRYFREVGVPAAMVDTVRARALITLAPLVEDLPEPEPRVGGWSALRPEQVFDALKRRAQHIEDTNLECRLAASLSDEAVAATHVQMALETAQLLRRDCSPDEAIMHYVRSFELTSIDTQIIFRRALAQWAEREPGLEEVELIAPVLAVSARVPQLESGKLRVALRAIV
jgi:hypothetical protein